MKQTLRTAIGNLEAIARGDLVVGETIPECVVGECIALVFPRLRELVDAVKAMEDKRYVGGRYIASSIYLDLAHAAIALAAEIDKTLKQPDAGRKE